MLLAAGLTIDAQVRAPDAVDRHMLLLLPPQWRYANGTKTCLSRWIAQVCPNRCQEPSSRKAVPICMWLQNQPPSPRMQEALPDEYYIVREGQLAEAYT